MDKMQNALDDHKALISKPLILASLEPGDTVLMYVTATTQVISVAMIVEWEEPSTSTRYKGWSITSARSSPTMRPTTIRYKSYFMSSYVRSASSCNISRAT
jgi:hypothetical protein